MPELVDVDFTGVGSRFLLFAQPPVVEGFVDPEVVWVSPPPGAIGPGPCDDRMVVRDAVAKPRHYEFPYLPPYAGPVHAPVRPGRDGHFDHLRPGTREFEAAHMYGTLRLVLDIWERYFERTIEWHFASEYSRMELIPWLDWNNAQSGWGFIECGYRASVDGTRMQLALNFDVLAHELGHSILYSEIGLPSYGTPSAPFLAFHESASDLVAIIALLHFDSVNARLLERTSGNLFVRNFLNRIGEISPVEQIRLASNRLRMSDVPDLRTPPERLSQRERHRMGEPLTGAIFDVLVEVFQQSLVDRRLIAPELDRASRRGIGERAHLGTIQRAFDAEFAANPSGFAQALYDARDFMGMALARVWRRLDHDLDFVDVGRALLEADLELSDGRFQREILQALVWREIGGSTRPGARWRPSVRRRVVGGAC